MAQLKGFRRLMQRPSTLDLRGSHLMVLLPVHPDHDPVIEQTGAVKDPVETGTMLRDTGNQARDLILVRDVGRDHANAGAERFQRRNLRFLVSRRSAPADQENVARALLGHQPSGDLQSKRAQTTRHQVTAIRSDRRGDRQVETIERPPDQTRRVSPPVADRDLVIAVRRQKFAHQCSAIGLVVDIDQPAPDIRVLQRDHPPVAPENRLDGFPAKPVRQRRLRTAGQDPDLRLPPLLQRLLGNQPQHCLADPKLAFNLAREIIDLQAHQRFCRESGGQQETLDPPATGKNRTPFAVEQPVGWQNFRPLASR